MLDTQKGYIKIHLLEELLLCQMMQLEKVCEVQTCIQETEIKGKNVVLVDDSIVRGTTSREIVKMVRESGAKSVYLVSTCPEIKHPSFME